eukprot:6201394-Pleurochrysis_carterae.AAC.1
MGCKWCPEARSCDAVRHIHLGPSTSPGSTGQPALGSLQAEKAKRRSCYECEAYSGSMRRANEFRVPSARQKLSKSCHLDLRSGCFGAIWATPPQSSAPSRQSANLLLDKKL